VPVGIVTVIDVDELILNVALTPPTVTAVTLLKPTPVSVIVWPIMTRVALADIIAGGVVEPDETPPQILVGETAVALKTPSLIIIVELSGCTSPSDDDVAVVIPSSFVLSVADIKPAALSVTVPGIACV
jgi:hypothetical protein